MLRPTILRYIVFKCDRLVWLKLVNAGTIILGDVVVKCCDRLAGALGEATALHEGLI